MKAKQTARTSAGLFAVVALLAAGHFGAAQEEEEPPVAEELNMTDYSFVCMVRSAADSGSNTLRQCITQANAVGGNVLIDFAIGMKGKTIDILSPLPVLANPISAVTMRGAIVDERRHRPTISGAGAGSGVGLEFLENVSLKMINMNIAGFETGMAMLGTGPPGPPSVVTLMMTGCAVTGSFTDGVVLIDVVEARLLNVNMDGNGVGQNGNGLLVEFETMDNRKTFAYTASDSSFSNNGDDGIDMDFNNDPPTSEQYFGTLVLRNCRANGNRESGVDVINTEMTITGCEFKNNVESGFEAGNCEFSRIASSYFLDNAEDGLYMHDSTETKIISSCALDGNGAHGVHMVDSEVRKIVKTSMSGNDGNGIDMSDLSRVTGTIIKSAVNNNGAYGYQLADASVINLMIKSTVVGNELGAAASGNAAVSKGTNNSDKNRESTDPGYGDGSRASQRKADRSRADRSSGSRESTTSRQASSRTGR